MKITHYGHACVLLETDAARILIDPGAYSKDFDDLCDLDLVLITHAHPDHVDAGRLVALLAANPKAKVVTNAEVATSLGLEDAILVATGDSIVEKGVAIRVTGPMHAVIHPELPQAQNTGFIVDEAVWHPGDSLDPIDNPPATLLVPIGGPWMKASDAIDFVRSIAPAVAIPIHQSGLATVHRDLHTGLLKNLSPTATTVLVLEEGVPAELPEKTDR